LFSTVQSCSWVRLVYVFGQQSVHVVDVLDAELVGHYLGLERLQLVAAVAVALEDVHAEEKESLDGLQQHRGRRLEDHQVHCEQEEHQH